METCQLKKRYCKKKKIYICTRWDFGQYKKRYFKKTQLLTSIYKRFKEITLIFESKQQRSAAVYRDQQAEMREGGLPQTGANITALPLKQRYPVEKGNLCKAFTARRQRVQELQWR